MRSPNPLSTDRKITHLINAICSNNILEVRNLIKNNAYPNLELDTDKLVPLHLAAEIGNLDIVKALLKAGARPNLISARGVTPLHLAAENGNLNIVKALLEARAEPDLTMNNGSTPLHLVAKNGNLNIFNTLLKARAKHDLVTKDGDTPLHLAAQYGNLNIVKALLKDGVEPNLRSIKGATPLHLAAEKGHLNIVEALLKARVEPNLRSINGATPLHLAVQNGHFNIVEALLKAEVEPNLAMNDGANPLHYAAKNGNLDIVKALLKAGAKPDEALNNGTTPLHLAAENGNLNIVKALLKARVEPNLRSINGATPLHLAVHNGHFKIVEALLKAGAKPDEALNNGATPLHLVAENGHLNIVKALLKAGVEPNLRSINGITPLHVAAQYGNLDIIEALLKAGAKPDEALNNGFTPLHLAAENGNLNIVKALLKAGAKPDVKKIDGATPLHFAAQNDHLNIVEALLKAGAKPNLAMKDGANPVDYAAEKNNLDIFKALLEAGAEPNFKFLIFLDLTNNKLDFLKEYCMQISIKASSPIIFLSQISILSENSIDEVKKYNYLEVLFNFLSEDRKIELLTQQNNGKTILDYAIENNNYSVASLIYSKSIDLIYEDDVECQAMKSNILIKALKNYSNETEFFEFFKLVNGNEKLLPEHETEIQRLKLLESQEDQIKIDNALAEIKKTQEKHLTDVWKFFKDDDLEGFKALIARDPTKIISFRYNEDEGDETHSKKTFLHRLVEHHNEKSEKFLLPVRIALRRLERAQKPVPNLDLPCEVQYRDFTTKINKGEVRGVTPLYLAINKINLNAVKYLIPYSNLNTPIKKVNSSTGAIKEYSLFELALEKATSDSSNPTLASLNLTPASSNLTPASSNPTPASSNLTPASSDSENSFEILKIIIQKASFPESAEQKEKIARNYEKYKPKIKELLEEAYPEKIKEIKELAKKYKDAESSSRQDSGTGSGSGIQLRSDLRSRFEGLVPEKSR
jgi:cytohesin